MLENHHNHIFADLTWNERYHCHPWNCWLLRSILFCCEIPNPIVHNHHLFHIFRMFLVGADFAINCDRFLVKKWPPERQRACNAGLDAEIWVISILIEISAKVIPPTTGHLKGRVTKFQQKSMNMSTCELIRACLVLVLVECQALLFVEKTFQSAWQQKKV